MCKHTSLCDQLECMHSLMIAYMHALGMEASEANPAQTMVYRAIVEELEHCRIRLVSRFFHGDII